MAACADRKRQACSLSWPDGALGSQWRYEVFVVPELGPPEEPWASWPRQESDPLVCVEVERQNTFYCVSLELGRRLLLGELEGFGRSGSIAGPWTSIPAEAWHVLRVPYDGFQNWRFGRLAGGGLEMWDMQIFDRAGLPLRAAAVAYGPPEQAFTVQRAEVFGIYNPADINAKDNIASPARSAPHARMAEHEAKQTLTRGFGERISEASYGASRAMIDDALLRALLRGELVADVPNADQGWRTVHPDEWRLSEFASRTSGPLAGAVTEIRVRPPTGDVLTTETETASVGTAYQKPLQGKRRGGGPRQKYDCGRMKAVLLRRLEEDGAPADGDGGQAELERLAISVFNPDHVPAESIIRSHIKETIVAFRNSR